MAARPLLERVLRLLCEEHGGGEVRAALDEVTDVTVRQRQRRRRSASLRDLAERAGDGVPVTEIDRARARRLRREG